MSIATDDLASSEFAALGLPIENFFVVGDDDLIAFWHPVVGVRFMILERREIADACREYLAARGVRRFTNASEIVRTSTTEKWPGWDLHSSPS